MNEPSSRWIFSLRPSRRCFSFPLIFGAVSQIILKRLAGETPSHFLKFISHSEPDSKFKRKRGAGRGGGESLLLQENNNKIITFFCAVKRQEVKILTVKYTTASSAFLLSSSLMFSFTL